MGARTVLSSLVTLSMLLWLPQAAADPVQGAGPDNRITGLEILQEEHATRVVLQGEKTPTFTVFKLKDPDRLVVDLIRSDLGDLDLPREVDDARIGRIATTSFRQAGSVVSRFIIGLKPGARFNAKAQGTAVHVIIRGKDAPPARVAAARPATQEPKPVPAAPAAKPKAPEAKPVTEAAPTPDHRVVESRGVKKRAPRRVIRRITSGDGDRLAVLANAGIDNYEILEVYHPFRVVLDLYGASMPDRTFERKLSGRFAERVRAFRYDDKVRVVLDCAGGERQPYDVVRTRRGLRIRFGEGERPVEVAAAGDTETRLKSTSASTSTSTSTSKSKSTSKSMSKSTTGMKNETGSGDVMAEAAGRKGPATLRDVTFRHEDALARVVLDVDGDIEPRVVHSDKRSTVLELDNCKIPVMLERTLDTSEFGSEIQSLSAYRVPGEENRQKVKLVAVTSDRVPSRLERRDGKLHWVFETSKREVAAMDVTAKAPEPESREYAYAPDQVAGYSVRQPDLAAGSGAGSKKRRYRGKRISLDFKDADIHNILRLISEVAKLNIITSDEVSGKVTITMRNVPWDQALDIILKTKKLGKVRHGNIIRVATLSELEQERKMAADAAEARKVLEPLRVRMVAVNYATAGDIANQVKDVLSERGTVSVDQRTNVLIIKDVLENLIKAEGLVRSLDTETPQVLIEARIVEANTQYAREVGIQWGGNLNFSAATGNPTGIPFPNTIGMSGGADDTRTNTDLSGTANPGQFAVNLPAAVGGGSGGALGFIFGSAGGSARLNLRLSALENRGVVNIISAPKVATLDNHTAKIGQGVSIPISVVSAAGVNTQFVEAKLELEVTPHITQEGSILMAIKVMKNEPDFSRTGARGDPTILKKEAETEVMVRDGDTTVIGGIYTKKTSETYTGVPFLSKIPVLGFFFRNTKKNDDRTELLIFVTPRIINRLEATVSQK